MKTSHPSTEWDHCPGLQCKPQVTPGETRVGTPHHLHSWCFTISWHRPYLAVDFNSHARLGFWDCTKPQQSVPNQRKTLLLLSIPLCLLWSVTEPWGWDRVCLENEGLTSPVPLFMGMEFTLRRGISMNGMIRTTETTTNHSGRTQWMRERDSSIYVLNHLKTSLLTTQTNRRKLYGYRCHTGLIWASHTIPGFPEGHRARLTFGGYG